LIILQRKMRGRRTSMSTPIVAKRLLIGLQTGRRFIHNAFGFIPGDVAISASTQPAGYRPGSRRERHRNPANP
jgi:hypothetical protein